MLKYQNYISDELTHFVGRSLQSDDERYNLLVEILKTGILRTRNGNKKGSFLAECHPGKNFSSNESYNPDIVCFCDIPISDFEIHMKKYSYFGIGFKKHFLIHQGVRPVYYIPQNAIVANKNNIEDIFDNALKEFNLLNSKDGKISFRLKSFFTFHVFSFFKFFDPTLNEEDENNYYMEREWRGLERIEFNFDDISRIILPSKFVKNLYKDIPSYSARIHTPD